MRFGAIVKDLKCYVAVVCDLEISQVHESHGAISATVRFNAVSRTEESYRAFRCGAKIYSTVRCGAVSAEWFWYGVGGNRWKTVFFHSPHDLNVLNRGFAGLSGVLHFFPCFNRKTTLQL